jgi:hypothetical protein
MMRFSVKRLFVLLGVVGATAAIVASSALAGPTPTTECKTGIELSGQITGNLVVPAGADCSLSFATITGNVSVQGDLYTTGSTIVGNVNVNSGGALYEFNYPTIMQGNLSITGSAGDGYYGANGFNTAYGQSEVWGNFSYTGNSAPLYIGGSGLLVKRNFSHTLNTSAHQIQPDALDVLGNSNIS